MLDRRLGENKKLVRDFLRDRSPEQGQDASADDTSIICDGNAVEVNVTEMRFHWQTKLGAVRTDYGDTGTVGVWYTSKDFRDGGSPLWYRKNQRWRREPEDNNSSSRRLRLVPGRLLLCWQLVSPSFCLLLHPAFAPPQSPSGTDAPVDFKLSVAAAFQILPFPPIVRGFWVLSGRPAANKPSPGPVRPTLVLVLTLRSELAAAASVSLQRLPSLIIYRPSQIFPQA
ncbi:hypothetical protein VTN00DRAFT_707 [Thermoascus crustaceus]|uniref:uncharacterized protein n=1 Tax=Thermoascus crustaceus TaxID=5088 RepID=UPI0037432B59